MSNTVALKALKSMDAPALFDAFHQEVTDSHSGDEARQLERALEVATDLHDGQWRKVYREGDTLDPYIVHPVRNALRLHRIGCEDTDVLCATLLHDTVEDCLNKFVSDYCNRSVKNMSNVEKRESSFQWIADEFSEKTSNIVRNVTNPLPGKGSYKMSPEYKRNVYRVHVQESLGKDAGTFLTKFSDFVDNAGSLPHMLNRAPESAQAVERMGKKYAPLVSVFRHYASHHELNVGSKGMHEISAHLNLIENKLNLIIA